MLQSPLSFGGTKRFKSSSKPVLQQDIPRSLRSNPTCRRTNPDPPTSVEGYRPSRNSIVPLSNRHHPDPPSSNDSSDYARDPPSSRNNLNNIHSSLTSYQNDNNRDTSTYCSSKADRRQESHRSPSVDTIRGSDPSGIISEPDPTMDDNNFSYANDDAAERKKKNEPSKPGAYKVIKTRPGEPIVYRLSIPDGVDPGTEFPVIAGSRRVFVRCPETAVPEQVIEIVLPPEPVIHFKLLKPATLTCSFDWTPSERKNGGARPMMSDIRKVNTRALRSGGDAVTHVVTVPDNVSPGEMFTVSVAGRRFQAKCPPGTSAGQQIRIAIPPPTSSNDDKTLSSLSNHTTDTPPTQAFYVTIPPGIRPGQPFAISVTLSGQEQEHNQQRVLVRCPNNAVAGQSIKFHLPTAKVVENIQLKYESFQQYGWRRTIRAEDLKFQWVRLSNTSKKNDRDSSRTSSKDSKLLRTPTHDVLDVDDMSDFDISRSAYVRKITLLEGNDPRLRTGLVELIAANEAVVDSKIIWNNRTMMSFPDIAVQQSKPLQEKHNWFCQTICRRLITPSTDEDGPIRIFVRREHLLQDSVSSIMSLGLDDMRKQWKIQFMGEPVLDAGGPTREWFELVTDQVFNPAAGLWIPSTNNQACVDINPNSDISCPREYLILFRFTGRILGRALFDQQLIPRAHLVRTIYKYLLGWPITFEDIKDQDEAYYESLRKLSKMKDIANMCLDFTVTEERMGSKDVNEIVENGSAKEVNNENVGDYLEANFRYRVFKRIKPQLTELLMGFYDIVPEPALTIFDVNELELILCGFPDIVLADWQEHTEYRGLFENTGSENKTIRWFWEVVEDEFDVEMRARLLQFATGTSGVPAAGFAALQGSDGSVRKFTIHGVDSSQLMYPKSHTCFNRIDLPTYGSKKELSERLKIAIATSYCGFDTE